MQMSKHDKDETFSVGESIGRNDLTGGTVEDPNQGSQATPADGAYRPQDGQPEGEGVGHTEQQTLGKVPAWEDDKDGPTAQSMTEDGTKADPDKS